MAPSAGRDRSATAVGVGAVVASAIVLVQRSFLLTPYATTSDGMNGSFWVLGGRALAADPLGTRFGAVAPTREPAIYTHHPPGLLLPSWLAGLAGHLAPFAGRIAVLMATAVAAGLIVLVLQELGVSRLAAALGTIVAFATPMVLVFGTMLDTWTFGLPTGAALLLVEARRIRGRPVSSRAAFTIAFAAALTSWLGLLLAATFGGLGLLRRLRGRPDGAGAVTGGAVAATVLTIGWVLSVPGGLDDLLGSGNKRFREQSQAPGGMLAHLGVVVEAVQQLLTMELVLLGLIGILLARRCSDLVRLVIWTTAVVTAWCVVFHDAAAVHPYWPYWGVLPLALCLAGGIDALLRLQLRAVVLRGAAAIAAALLVLGSVGATSVGAAELKRNAAAGELVRRTSWPNGRVVFVNDLEWLDTNWIAIETGLRPDVRRSPQLSDVPAVEPVLVRLLRHRPGLPCLDGTAGAFAVASAGQVRTLSALDGVRRCT